MQEKASIEEKASLFQVIRMVLWTMIGVRGQKGYEDDIAKITPKQAITAGVIGAIIFVLTVVLLVNLAINYLG
ncbi:MAG: DUF2970 domain-containing protein [Methylotenera sp.]|jgi:Protein of unknown function (DUF2970)